MKKRVILGVALVMVFLVFGCSKSTLDLAEAPAERQLARTSVARSAVVMPQAAPMTAIMYDSIQTEERSGGASSDAANLINTERKLIKRAFVTIRVENLNMADASITELINKYGAYAASTEAEENSRFYSLRVPASLYDIFLTEMSGMGRLIRRSESTEDVTLRYYDLEGRLEMKRELLRTFQAYLIRARTIEEILSVETRIAELQNDIDRTGTQLRHLANMVDYATVDLNLLGPIITSPIRSTTLGERIKQLFGNFGSFLSTIAVIIVGIVIYGIPLLVLLALLFWVLFGRIGLMKKLWMLVTKKQE